MSLDHLGSTSYEVTFPPTPALLKLLLPPASTRFLDYLGPILTILGQFGPFLGGLGIILLLYPVFLLVQTTVLDHIRPFKAVLHYFRPF